jgi:hypothetical protein
MDMPGIVWYVFQLEFSGGAIGFVPELTKAVSADSKMLIASGSIHYT